VGVAGLVGSGRTEMLRTLFGIDKARGGSIWLEGRPLEVRTPLQAITARMGLVPEDRKQEGLVLEMAIRQNLSLAALRQNSRAFLNRRYEQTLAQLRSLLRNAGRSRGIDAEAARLREALRHEQMRQLPLVEQAMGRQALALLRQLDAASQSADDLQAAAEESFNQHPDAGIITSFPGIGALTGARVLAEIGDDRSRFKDARGLKAYAGAAPITRASGKSRSVTQRKVKNNRLAAAGYTWAFAALTASPGARAHYDRRRDAGDRHTAAQRNLFNRLLGCLWHCLQAGQHYDEATAFPAAKATPAAA